MQQIEPLNDGKFYHIYNRGINSCDLFHDTANYSYFLSLYEHHISPVADTYAWVLMKNHFHFLVKIKDGEGVIPDRVSNPVRDIDPSKCFSNLFNAYAQAFNKRFNRHGNLFERPFKRKLIEDMEYLKTMVIYIHNNPVHHKFTEHAMDYLWSSYLTCISVKSTHLQRDIVIGWFDGVAGFKGAHDNPFDIKDMESWLGL